MEKQTDPTPFELRSSFAATIKELNIRVAEAVRQHKLAFKGIDWVKTAEAFRQLNAKLKTDWAKAAKSFPQFKAGLPERLKTLAVRGWFISGRHTPLAVVYPLASLFQTGRVEDGHQALCRHFSDALSSIEHSLIGDFPNRAQILKKAFAAHRAGDYELSIPVLLAQADGIARDTFAEKIPRFSVYTKSKARVPINTFIDEFLKDSLFTSNILAVALCDLPLNASEGNPILIGEVLNRHGIIHGTDTTYATPLNSWRAISWLEFVSYFRGIRRMRKNPSHPSRSGKRGK